MPTIDNRDCLHLLGSARQRRAKVRPPKLGLAERALRRYTSKKIYASFSFIGVLAASRAWLSMRSEPHGDSVIFAR